jgi:hypothetical protein
MVHRLMTFCLLALVVDIQSLPTVENDRDANRSYDEESKEVSVNENEHYPTRKSLRQSNKFIDGAIHRIKTASITYRQRLREGQCLVEYEGQFLTENTVLQIRRKLYRVEECQLERVFHACGPNLLLMLNVVCRAVEKQQTTTLPSPVESRRQTISSADIPIRYLRPRADKTPRVITESCCENLCTISELTRYCHR